MCPQLRTRREGARHALFRVERREGIDPCVPFKLELQQAVICRFLAKSFNSFMARLIQSQFGDRRLTERADAHTVVYRTRKRRDDSAGGSSRDRLGLFFLYTEYITDMRTPTHGEGTRRMTRWGASLPEATCRTAQGVAACDLLDHHRLLRCLRRCLLRRLRTLR